MSNLLLGRHFSVKSPNYLVAAVREAVSLGFNSLMIYTASPQNTSELKLETLEIDLFKRELINNQLSIDNVVVHGSYLVNLANFSDPLKLSFSKKILKKQISLMKEIGLNKLVIHPGNSLNNDRDLSLMSVSDSINEILNETHYEGFKLIIETMSGKGTELGISFEEISQIIGRIKRKDVVGVCWDTCHLFSAGYQIRDDLESVLQQFDQKVGLHKLWLIHLNDSAHQFNSRKDRHANLGKGTIGLNSLREIVHHRTLKNVIKIMETPTKDSFYKCERLLLIKE